MTVKLSSMRVTADMDVSRYVQAMGQKDQADKKAVESTRAVGQALAAVDAASKDATGGLTKLSSAWVEGYREAQKFEREIRSIETLMAKGMGADRAALMLDGLQRKFGQVINAEEAHRRGLTMIAPVVASLKNEYDAMSAAAERAADKSGRISRIEQFRAAQRVEQAGDRTRADQIMQSHMPEVVERQRTLQIQKDIHDLNQKGLFTDNQRDALLATEVIRHQQSLRSIEGMAIAQGKYTTGVGFARHEVVNLSRQLQDVVVSLQGGQAPMTVLLQQGTQIADIFATSNASFGGFLKQAAVAAGRFALSMAGAATATAAAGAAALYMGQSYADGQREIERSINGVGRASGLTVQRINELAAAEANAAKVSVSTGRDIVSAFAATGAIRPESASGLIGLTKNYAAQTGQDITAAAAELAKAFSDPVRGADMLNEKLGFLNARTRAYIQSLVDQNDRAAAQRALMDAMSGSVAGAADRVGTLARMWEWVKNAASNAADAVGQAVAGQETLEQRLANLTASRDNLGFGTRGYSAKARAALQIEIENVQRQLYGEGQAQASRAEAARLAQQSLRVQGIVNEAQPFDEQLRKVKAELRDLQDFMSKSGADRFSADMERARKAVEALDHATTTLLSPLERIRKETDAAVQSIMARTLQERTAAELAKLQISLSGQKVDAATREAQALDVVKRAQAEANREARDALRTANDNLSLAGLNPYQRMVRETEIRARENRVRFGGGAAAGGMDGDFQSALDRMMRDIPGISIVSGYRSNERQRELFEAAVRKYGSEEAARKWVAPPGASMHNHGLAADLKFASDEARQRAHAEAARYGLKFPMGHEPWHIEPIGGRDRARAMGGNDGVASDVQLKERAAWMKDNWDPVIRAANDDLRNQNQLLDLQKAAVTQTAFEMGKYAFEQKAINDLLVKGIPVTEEMRRKIAELGDGYGRVAERRVSEQLQRDITFERDQMFRTPGEQAIAGRLRGTGVGMDSAIADQMRFNQQLEITKSLGTDALKGFIADIRAGKSGMEAMTNALNRLADKLIDMAAESLMANALGLAFKGNQAAPAGAGGSGLIGNLISGVFGSLFGGGGGAGAPLNIKPTSFHSGGTVGYGGTSMSLPGATVWGVPKFHTGLMHNELLAVLQHGENVLTGKDSARTASTIAGLAAGGGKTQVVINNNAPVEVTARESNGPMGPRIEVMIDQRIAAALGPGGAGHRMLRKQGVA